MLPSNTSQYQLLSDEDKEHHRDHYGLRPQRRSRSPDRRLVVSAVLLVLSLALNVLWFISATKHSCFGSKGAGSVPSRSKYGMP